MSHIEKEKLIKADIASIENKVRHAFNQGYDLGYKEGKANYSEIPTGSTDCISRQAVIDLMMQKWGENFSGDDAMQESIDAIREMPSVTPQEPIDKKFTKADIDAIVKAINTGWELRVNEILDKIKAEIEQYQSDYDVHGTEYDRIAWKAFNRCLQIIDKYKVETEPQESEDKE